MSQDNELCTLVVWDTSSCLMSDAMNSDTALTMLALVSEDPSNWEEATSVWPRYQTSPVPEFASSLPLEETSRETALEALQAAESWVVIDFEAKRVLTGGQFQELGRDAVFALVVDELGHQHCPLSIHLPPWWELLESVSVDEFSQARRSPISKPEVNRELLYGDVFLTELASKILATFESPAWQQNAARDNPRDQYPFTIAVHRDWLMTRRADLDGRMPRELLHGAKRWSDSVTWGQQLRFEDGGPMIAAPNDWNGFATAPMGSQEMCLYFDLCRELIGAGWDWCENAAGQSALPDKDSALTGLTQYLRKVKEDWLSSPFEDGSPPNFLIECDRRRVPCGSGVEIQGIDGVASEQHVDDCDCPICAMMADGMFGVGFSAIDGHHLELDDEFAFSMCETREEWEEQRTDFAEFNASLEQKQAATKDSDNSDPFASVWSGMGEDEPIEGDRNGYLKLAFMVGELVSDLQGIDADPDEVRMLHQAFGDYRRSAGTRQSAVKLNEILQDLGERFPDLVSKSADLQSRIEEAARAVDN